MENLGFMEWSSERYLDDKDSIGRMVMMELVFIASTILDLPKGCGNHPPPAAIILDDYIQL